MHSPRRGRHATLLATSLALTLLVGTRSVGAYCFTGYCPDPGNPSKFIGKPFCDGPADVGCRPARWREPCVSYSAQKNGSSQLPMDQVVETIQQAFTAWMNVDCGGGRHPSIRLDYFGLVDCRKNEFSNSIYGNANIYMFRESDWEATHPYKEGADVLAVTTVSYRADKDDPENKLQLGDILDADIDVNGAKDENGKVRFNFTVGDDDIQYDLLSVLTHEAGHFLGLLHSADTGATMTPIYNKTEKNLRQLSADDIAAICSLYPPDRESAFACTSLPRHGYSGECAAEQQAKIAASGCVLASSASSMTARLPVALASAALVSLAARRRRKSLER
jgi:Matrixin